MKTKHFKYVTVFLLVMVSFFLGRESKNIQFENSCPKEVIYENSRNFETNEFEYLDTVLLFNEEEAEVYVCNGKYSKRYHYKKSCRGLSNCKSSISKVSLEEAKRRGRTLCGWED